MGCERGIRVISQPTTTAQSTIAHTAAAPAWSCWPSRWKMRLAQPGRRRRSRASARRRVVMMSPQGATLNHERVMKFAAQPGLILLCGRYEAIDQRLLDRVVDEEVSLGDFVLSGGELPAMALMDAVVRQLPGVLNDSQSAVQDSFVDVLLDCPHYTRPEEYQGVRVPDVLLGGHHAEIEAWRRREALRNTLHKRPDLIVKARKNKMLSRADEAWLASLAKEEPKA